MGDREEEFVYRISTSEEWQSFQKEGYILGGQLDKSCGFIHLSKLSQVQPTLQTFFLNTSHELYLLQIDTKKLGDGLVYEVAENMNENNNSFPHFYGANRSFSAMPLDVVTKAEKLCLLDGRFTCTMLH